ncbi:TetR/AcrR family transcriptional regulator [Colwellia sp. D2M02]|uniref:TetR/AcrR family transcriptional regulator n=1 Tax=Colwellia sp. D2M02 TaxID=2841562 RepID=UPI001C08CBE0|nr:TetR/AcrR family transcriptional regulator [Colwellia sp. D2M02]MBU2892650.1 TetR/AcrR family transcriptional regulator [Colwellia sp. D2M02]
MAKVAKFDREAVIDIATKLYWKKGFHATSMRNLQDAIDMRPGSIYAAFGSKEGLFTETLRNYTDMGIEQLKQCRRENSSPIEALKAFMKAQVIDTQNSAPNGVCMLAKTINELTNENQALIDITKAHLGEIATEFVKLIEEAQVLGEVDNTKSAQELATHIQIQLVGLRTYGKVNNDKAQLNNIIDNIFNHYPF